MTECTRYSCCHCVNFTECGCGIGGNEPHGYCETIHKYVEADEEPCDGFILDCDL